MQKRPDLNPDWFGEIGWFVMKKIKILRNNKHSNIVLHIGKTLRLTEVCKGLFVVFLETGTTVAFFSKIFSLSKHDLMIILRGLHTDLPHFFSFKMLVL